MYHSIHGELGEKCGIHCIEVLTLAFFQVEHFCIRKTTLIFVLWFFFLFLQKNRFYSFDDDHVHALWLIMVYGSVSSMFIWFCFFLNENWNHMRIANCYYFCYIYIYFNQKETSVEKVESLSYWASIFVWNWQCSIFFLKK